MNLEQHWEYLLRRLSIPLWAQNAAGEVVDLGTGTLVDFCEKTILLTAAHVTVDDEAAWAVLLRYHPETRNAELHVLGPLNYFLRVRDGKGEWIDIAYAFVPREIRPTYQVIKDTGRVVHEDRLIIVTDMAEVPAVGRRYGFAGYTKPFIAPSEGFLGGEFVAELNLVYTEARGDLLVFTVSSGHRGDLYYKGCSGSPICDEDGTFVGILIGGDEATGEVWGLAFTAFRSALAAASMSAAS